MRNRRVLRIVNRPYSQIPSLCPLSTSLLTCNLCWIEYLRQYWSNSGCRLHYEHKFNEKWTPLFTVNPAKEYSLSEYRVSHEHKVKGQIQCSGPPCRWVSVRLAWRKCQRMSQATGFSCCRHFIFKIEGRYAPFYWIRTYFPILLYNISDYANSTSPRSAQIKIIGKSGYVDVKIVNNLGSKHTSLKIYVRRHFSEHGQIFEEKCFHLCKFRFSPKLYVCARPDLVTLVRHHIGYIDLFVRRHIRYMFVPLYWVPNVCSPLYWAHDCAPPYWVLRTSRVCIPPHCVHVCVLQHYGYRHGIDDRSLRETRWRARVWEIVIFRHVS